MTNEQKAYSLSREIAQEHDYKESAAFDTALAMAEWKDEQFWSKENIEKIIITYSSFPDRSCPGELVKKTIEKLKSQE